MPSNKQQAAERTRLLGVGNINKLIWDFSLPAVVGMVVNASYIIINRMFIGHAAEGGRSAIAAITVTFPILILFMAISMLIGVGATTLVSIRLGEQKVDEAEKILGNALSLLILGPLILCAAMYFYIEPLLIFSGAEDNVLPYAIAYLEILIPSMVIMSVSMGMNNFIRAEGNPITAMQTQILGGAINVGCNYIFVMQFGWGVQGAALGSCIGQLFAMIWVLSYFFSQQRSLLKIKLSNLVIDPSLVRLIVIIGMAPFLMQLTASIQQLILNKVLETHGGEVALAAFGIVGSLAQLLIMPIVGLSQGAQPILGYNYGANRFDRVRETLVKSVIYASIFSIFAWLIIHIYPRQLVSLFISNEPETVVMAAHALEMFFAVLFIVGFQIICSGYFQAIGKPNQATLLSLSRQILFFIPLLIILPRYLGLEGVWLAPPIADGAATVVTAGFIYLELKLSGMLTNKGAKAKTILKQS